MFTYGKKRTDVEESSQRGIEGTAKPAQFGGSEERSRVGVDAATRQKEVATRLVLIEWVDSYGCSAVWQKIDVESVAPMVCRSVGWLVYEGDDCKVIVPHLTEKDHPYIPQQGCGDMTIPNCAIVRMFDLAEGGEPTPPPH